MVTPTHTGLEARLKELNPAQALTVGDALELIKVVNHNAYRLEALAKEVVAPQVLPSRTNDSLDDLFESVFNRKVVDFRGLSTIILTTH
jgi:hypothetical protein